MSDRGVLVDVAVPLPVDRLFTYRLDASAPPPPGTRALVPFRRRERIGWIVGSGSDEGLSRVRPVLDVLDDEPSVPGELFRLCRWAADYYLAPLGLTLRTAVPSVLADASRDYLSPTDGGEDAGPAPDLSSRERRLLEALARRDAPRRVRTLARELEMGSLWPEIRGLKERGLLRHETVPPREPTVKTRKVVRVAVVYTATAFAVLQAADIMLPRLAVPEWAMSLIVVLVVLGFAMAVPRLRADMPYLTLGDYLADVAHDPRYRKALRTTNLERSAP